MPSLLLDLEDYATHTPSDATCIRRADDARSLCGSEFGTFAVAEPGAELPYLLPLEETCPECVRIHVAGEAG